MQMPLNFRINFSLTSSARSGRGIARSLAANIETPMMCLSRFRTALITSVLMACLILPPHATAAEELTYPKEKFPFCLTVRTKTLNCERETVNARWVCHRRAKPLRLDQQCLDWDYLRFWKCAEWTDGQFIYGSSPPKILVPLRERTADPTFMCRKYLPPSQDSTF